ncbi:proton myo-inositol cotransporter-like isoform X5 [Equus caballus]
MGVLLHPVSQIQAFSISKWLLKLLQPEEGETEETCQLSPALAHVTLPSPKLVPYCDECMLDPDCGFCYKMNKSTVIDSSCVPVNKASTNAAAWGRCENETKFKTEEVFWAYNFCPTPYSWTALLGLLLYLVFFAPGMGPMPWTVNSEIYPLWARSPGNACSSGINWIFNVLVSLTFLHTAEYLTYYGAFFLYAGFAAVGLLFIYGCLPETKGKKLEEIESLFDNRPGTCGASDSDEGRYIEYIRVKGSNYHLSDNDASDVK